MWPRRFKNAFTTNKPIYAARNRSCAHTLKAYCWHLTNGHIHNTCDAFVFLILPKISIFRKKKISFFLLFLSNQHWSSECEKRINCIVSDSECGIWHCALYRFIIWTNFNCFVVQLFVTSMQNAIDSFQFLTIFLLSFFQIERSGIDCYVWLLFIRLNLTRRHLFSLVYCSIWPASVSKGHDWENNMESNKNLYQTIQIPNAEWI